MLDLNSPELDIFSDEEIILLEEMTEMLEEMSPEQIDEFVAMVETMGKAKKENKSLFVDNSEYYH